MTQSVERPSGDTTSYAYTPAGRLASEVRTGQVAYSRSYGYNPDGSRVSVMRDDALNGSHWDFYFYEAASGRLQSVLDVWSSEVNELVWNPEGTLARWEASGLHCPTLDRVPLHRLWRRVCGQLAKPLCAGTYQRAEHGVASGGGVCERTYRTGVFGSDRHRLSYGCVCDVSSGK